MSIMMSSYSRSSPAARASTSAARNARGTKEGEEVGRVDADGTTLLAYRRITKKRDAVSGGRQEGLGKWMHGVVSCGWLKEGLECASPCGAGQ
jgi:hypothetical protein